MKPWVTPVTRLFTSVRLRPHIWRPRSAPSRGATVTPCSPTLASTSFASLTLNSPLGPFTRTDCPSTVALTPFGSETGFLPIRDISKLRSSAASEHAADHFPAHVFFAGARVRHHALRRGDDRKTKAAAVRTQITHRGVYTSPRRRDTLQLANDRPPFVILELNLKLLQAALELHFRITPDEALRLQYVEHAHALSRKRRLYFRCSTHLAIPDACKEIADRIRYRHVVL